MVGRIMAETVFSKILRNEIPCHKVYEDEHVLAFLDINPVSRGPRVSPVACVCSSSKRIASSDACNESKWSVNE